MVTTRAFTVRRDRIWKLPSGVRVRLDAVVRDGETRQAVDGSDIAGPAALVHAAHGDSTILHRWIAEGSTVQLANELFVLRRVVDVGVLNAAITNSEYALAPLPTRQPGRAATFGPP